MDDQNLESSQDPESSSDPEPETTGKADPESEPIQPSETEQAAERNHAAVAKMKSLRVWPAIVLLVLLWAMRLGSSAVEEFSIAVMMVRFMMPLILSGVILLWWVFFSRARVTEKLVGVVALAIIGFVTTTLSHQTVKGFGTLLFAVPWGISAFAAMLVVMRDRRPTLRTTSAVLAALIGFGYWCLVRTNEILGDFDTRQTWRWQPDAEERFLASLDSRLSEPSDTTDTLGIETLATPDWPEFRGPRRDGTQPGVVLDEDWNAQPPREVWRIRVGPGWSSFSVAGDRLFTQEQRGEIEVVVCYDADDGSQRWIHEDETRFWEVVGGTGPRGTPTISDGKLYTLGATGLLNCLDPITGERLWQQNISVDAERDPPQWGFASSPLVTHGVVIVHAGGADEKGLLAYDRETGEMKWSAAAGNDTYSSPQLSTVDGKECVLMLTNTGVVLVEPTTGEMLGEHEWFFPGYRVVQPLVVDGSSILLGTPMGTGTQRADVEWDGESFSTKDRWTSIRMSPYFNDYVAHEGFLYGIDKNIFACIDIEEGELQWKRGRYGNGQVLLLPSGNQLLVTTEKGDLVLLRATPERHTELARFELFNSRTWNHPVLVGNRLYVRNAEEAVCLEMPVVEQETARSDTL